MLRRVVVFLVVVIGLFSVAALSSMAQDEAASESGYVQVNGLNMYYEIHGVGDPLIVLHGAYMSIVSMGDLIPQLAETRQVIAVELQGHGRTADIDRPLTYEQMADDVTLPMQEIGVQQADILGYSMGGSVALQIATRHPERVDKLVVISTTYNSNGWYPEIRAFAEFMTPEIFVGTPIETDYLQLAPDPQGFATLVEKLVALETAEQNWPPESIAAIAAPTLIIIGDSDSVQLDHAVEMFRLRGGGIEGDLNGLPTSRLAVLPGATHLTILEHADTLTALITEFLDTTTTE